MSQRDGFTGGLLIGTVVGGVVGGVLGALLARRDPKLATPEQTEVEPSQNLSHQAAVKKRQMKSADHESLEMESARRSLEDKIAQLNETIDQVRNELGNVNNNPSQDVKERYLSQD